MSNGDLTVEQARILKASKSVSPDPGTEMKAAVDAELDDWRIQMQEDARQRMSRYDRFVNWVFK